MVQVVLSNEKFVLLYTKKLLKLGISFLIITGANVERFSILFTAKDENILWSTLYCINVKNLFDLLLSIRVMTDDLP